MEKWGYGSPSGNMITEATGSDSEDGGPKNPKDWDVEKNPNADLSTPIPSTTSTSTFTSGGKRAGPAPTKKGKVMQEQDDFDLDDLDDDISAPDLQSDAFAATMDTAMAPPPPTATANAPMMEKEGEDLTGDGKIDSDDYLAAKDKAIKANLEEQHNCKSVHPGMNHDQWSEKYR